MHQNNCLVCGKELVYGKIESKKCFLCGKKELSSVFCQDNHYVCDTCHSKKALVFLKQFLSKNQENDPTVLLHTFYQTGYFHMHGPEHHFVIPMILLTILKNHGYSVSDDALEIAFQRCSQLPGGTCGYWGACAASLGVGIFTSIFTQSHPLKKEHYDTIHFFTASSLEKIAQKGGPRCCKRNLMLSLENALLLLKEKWNIQITYSPFVCQYQSLNKECIGINCPYFKDNQLC